LCRPFFIILNQTSAVKLHIYHDAYFECGSHIGVPCLERWNTTNPKKNTPPGTCRKKYKSDNNYLIGINLLHRRGGGRWVGKEIGYVDT
jgi:hypothetical protein